MKHKKSSKPNALKMSKRLRREVLELLHKAPINARFCEVRKGEVELLFNAIDLDIRSFVRPKG